LIIASCTSQIGNGQKSAIREELVTENVAGVDFIDPIKRRNENHKRRAFTLSELQKLLAASEGTEWKGLILAGLYLGQRLGDIARLTWANVDHHLGQVSSLSRQFHDLLVNAGLATPHGESREAGEEKSLRRTVNPLSFHSLRHTATSFMKSAGVNKAVAMDLVGHQSTAISAHYTTIDSEAKRKAINLMPDVLSLGGSK
jgi:integrase